LTSKLGEEKVGEGLKIDPSPKKGEVENG